MRTFRVRGDRKDCTYDLWKHLPINDGDTLQFDDGDSQFIAGYGWKFTPINRNFVVSVPFHIIQQLQQQ
jgi:hypothetical protein